MIQFAVNDCQGRLYRPSQFQPALIPFMSLLFSADLVLRETQTGSLWAFSVHEVGGMEFFRENKIWSTYRSC